MAQASDNQYGTIALASAGFGTIVAPVTGSVITVLGYGVTASGALTAQFWGGTVTALTGSLTLPTNGNLVNNQIAGVFQTASGVGLFGSISTGTLSGHLTYQVKGA